VRSISKRIYFSTRRGGGQPDAVTLDIWGRKNRWDENAPTSEGLFNSPTKNKLLPAEDLSNTSKIPVEKEAGGGSLFK